MCSDSPDMSGANDAARMTAQLSKEQLDWFKDIYASEAPARAAAAERAGAISDAQLASMQQNDAISKDYYDYQKNTYRPLEKQIVAEAVNYDTADRRAEESAAAKADVTMAVDAAQAATARNQQRSGVNPNSGKALALGSQMALGKAAMLAGADSSARRNVETQGYARRMDAANMGRNLASNQATSANIAMQYGNSSTNNAMAALTPSNQANGMMGSAYNTGINGNAAAGRIYTDIARTEASSGSGAWGALGMIGGAAIGRKEWSDKNMKEDIKPASESRALDAIMNTPVALWRYKEGSEADDGGREHIGPMAQDLQKTAGDAVAPGGKQIDMVNANGLVMAAIQGLNKKVDSLASVIADDADDDAMEKEKRDPSSGGKTSKGPVMASIYGEMKEKAQREASSAGKKPKGPVMALVHSEMMEKAKRDASSGGGKPKGGKRFIAALA
jgi:hypothetical protein